MVAGKHKSRSLRRVHKKTPGARNLIHYEKRKPQHAKCSCGKPLRGILRAIVSKFRNSPRSAKKNNRAYGGNLCSECARKNLKNKARKISL